MQESKKSISTLVEKENIPTLKFNDKATVKGQQEGLATKLMEATKLGNLHHGKVAIVFEDDEGLKRVETTIWSTGTDYICLKGGVWLPISRIHEVVF